LDNCELYKGRALEKAKQKPGTAIFACHERKQGWPKFLPIYILWCPRCKKGTETHPAGYGRISCDTCRYTDRIMTWERFRDKEIVPVIGLSFYVISAAAASAALFYLYQQFFQ